MYGYLSLLNFVFVIILRSEDFPFLDSVPIIELATFVSYVITELNLHDGPVMC